MVAGYEQLALFKSEATQLRGEIDTLMNDLMGRVENMDDDIRPENYKDYKALKANIKEEKETSGNLIKELGTISKTTHD
jgi:hypothetical protein